MAVIPGARDGAKRIAIWPSSSHKLDCKFSVVARRLGVRTAAQRPCLQFRERATDTDRHRGARRANDQRSNRRTTMSDAINRDRRRLIGAAALGVAAAQFNLAGAAEAQKTLNTNGFRPGANTSFVALKQIDAGLLNVCYAEAGPSDGEPV